MDKKLAVNTSYRTGDAFTFLASEILNPLFYVTPCPEFDELLRHGKLLFRSFASTGSNINISLLILQKIC